MKKTMIQAHRGASAYLPENTLEAFKLAAEQGADGVELDVQLTSDERVVVAHDAGLERVSDGNGYVGDFTYTALKKLNFGKALPNAGEPGHIYRLPLLSEVFELLKPTPLMINIELKTTERLYPGLPEKCAALAAEYGMEDRVLYSSFNHYSLLEIKKYAPDAKIGLLYGMGLADPWVYANHLKAYAIHPHYRVVAVMPETVEMCHKHGVAVNVFTVDDPDDINLMLRCGVDAVITDKPDVAIACRDGMVL